MDHKNLAVAYAMKKKMAHMCHGGDCAHPSHKMATSDPEHMAEGGIVSKRDRAMAAFIGSHQSEEKPEVDGGGPSPMMEEHISHAGNDVKPAVHHDVMNQMGAEDEGAGDMDSIHPMVMKIVMGRAKGYSKGGMVANEESGESSDEPSMAKWDGNEFDDLALRDGLEFKSTGANAGDEDGNAAEEHDRHNIVAKILKSRSKKDRMPRPA